MVNRWGLGKKKNVNLEIAVTRLAQRGNDPGMKPGKGDLVVPFPPSTLRGPTTQPMTSAMTWTVNGLGGAVGSGRNLFPLSFESRIRLGV